MIKEKTARFLIIIMYFSVFNYNCVCFHYFLFNFFYEDNVRCMKCSKFEMQSSHCHFYNSLKLKCERVTLTMYSTMDNAVDV